MLVNIPGSVKLNDDKHPVYFTTSDRIFWSEMTVKALLIIRVMQDRFDAGRGAARY